MARRIPRAKCPVDVIESPVYFTLIDEGAEGIRAWAIVHSINLLAEKQRSGVFRQRLPVIAKMIGFSSKDLEKAVELVNSSCAYCGEVPWFTVNESCDADERGHLVFELYDDWNPRHGGSRPGAGRPGGENSSGNQVAQLENDLKTSCAQDRCAQPGAPETRIPKPESETLVEEDFSENESATGATDSGGVASRGVSDSGLVKRVRMQMTFAQRVQPLIGIRGGEHGQAEADRVVVARWWDQVWPTHMDEHTGRKRAERAIDLAGRAKAKDRPMAWLTWMLREELQVESREVSWS